MKGWGGAPITHFDRPFDRSDGRKTQKGEMVDNLSIIISIIRRFHLIVDDIGFTCLEIQDLLLRATSAYSAPT